MSAPLSEVKALCTAAEYALVRASRKPQLEKLSAAEARRAAQRARKLLEKWQGQKRSQGRAHSRITGVGAAADRTARKVEILTEAVGSLEARASALAGQGTAAKKSRTAKSRASKHSVAKSLAAKPKKARASQHRATRAAVRAVLSDHTDELKAATRAKKKMRSTAAAPARGSATRVKPKLAKPAAVPAAEIPATKKPVAASRPAPRKPAVLPKKNALLTVALGQRLQPLPADQRRAFTAAKQARIAESAHNAHVRATSRPAAAAPRAAATR